MHKGTETELRQIQLKIFRYDPDSHTPAHYDTFTVTCGPFDQLLDILVRIKENEDPGLSFRSSCRHGICGSCAVRVQNKAILACKTAMFTLSDEFGLKLNIDPLAPDRVLKDLVIDMEDYWQKYISIKPYINTDSRKEAPPPSVQSALRSLELIDNADSCIQCGICYYVCPVVPIQTEFLGPAAFTKAWRFAADDRDNNKERLVQVSANKSGVWDCAKCLLCTEACPRHIDIFDKISKLHLLGVQEKAGVDPARIRHARGFGQAIRRTGSINELLLAFYTMGFGIIRMVPRGILMFFKRKLHINPFFPRSRRLREIKNAHKRIHS